MEKAELAKIQATLPHGHTFGGPGHVPPISEKRPCVYHLLPPFPANILVCQPNIFHKSTPVVTTRTAIPHDVPETDDKQAQRQIKGVTHICTWCSIDMALNLHRICIN